MSSAQRARREVGRLLNTGGHAQGLRHLRKLRTFASRLWRDITRKAGARAERDPRLTLVLERVGRLLTQKPQDRDKLYALHAPEVECIGKGKARTRHEFGVKCSMAVTNARAAGGQFVLGARTAPGNPYDGHTLARQIDQVETLTGQRVRRAYVDRGYRGHKLERQVTQALVLAPRLCGLSSSASPCKVPGVSLSSTDRRPRSRTR
jgi:IS5 family transposase